MELRQFHRKFAKGLADKRQRTRMKVNTRRIDKEKYWGVGVNVSEYEKTFRNAINLEPLEDYLEQMKIRAESWEDILKLFNVTAFFTDDVKILLGTQLYEAYNKGSKRVFDQHGEPIPIDFEVPPTEAIAVLGERQRQYFENFCGKAGLKVQKDLQTGLEKGESMGEIKRRIMRRVKGMRGSQARRIARSEVIKASAEGTERTLKQAGVEEVIWFATLDDRTCEVCKSLHLKVFGLNEPGRPRPVESTHPNCRCAIAGKF